MSANDPKRTPARATQSTDHGPSKCVQPLKERTDEQAYGFLSLRRSSLRDCWRFRTLFPVSLRALSKGHRVGACSQLVFINRKGALVVRPSQNQNVSCSIDAAREKFLLRVWLSTSERSNEGDSAGVPAGSLDTVIETQPDAHIFVASSANWDRRLEDVPKIDELPG